MSFNSVSANVGDAMGVTKRAMMLVMPHSGGVVVVYARWEFHLVGMNIIFLKIVLILINLGQFILTGKRKIFL